MKALRQEGIGFKVEYCRHLRSGSGEKRLYWRKVRARAGQALKKQREKAGADAD